MNNPLDYRRNPAFALCAVVTFCLGPSSALGAPAEYADAVLADEPILYYRLGETSGDAVNQGSLGASFDASYNGAPDRGVATVGGDAGVRFNDVADYLESLAPSPASLSGNPTFTAETVIWVPAGSSADWWAPYLHWGSPGTGNAVYFSFHQHIAFRPYAGFYNAGLILDGYFCADTWLHIVWTRDSGGGLNDSWTGTTVYINGVSVPLIPDPLLLYDDTLTVTASVFRVNRAADLTRYATFTMDELALYDRVLTPDEVTEHWEAYRDNAGDSDGDGLSDPADNCMLESNADQRDTNGDDYGNVCDADLTDDLETNFGDLALFKSVFFPMYDADADFDGDGSVSFGDLAKMKQLFLESPGPSGTAFLCDY